MRPSARLPNRLALARLAGWPRRLAALGCLLVAAAMAVRPPATRPPAPVSVTHHAAGLAALLHRGEVAAPVSVRGSPAGYLRRGDRVDLLVAAAPDPDGAGDPASAGPATPLATGVRVLRVGPNSATNAVSADASQLIVAVEPAVARRIASIDDGRVLAILDR